MALIQCNECGGQVATSAAACPHCGAPTATQSQAIGTPLATIQQTSKRLKTHILISAVLFFGGIILFFVMLGLAMVTVQNMDRDALAEGEVVANVPVSVGSMLAILSILAGLCLYLCTKLRIWWHHK